MSGASVVGSVVKVMPGNIKRQLVSMLYNYLSRKDTKGAITFLNYGYLPATVTAIDNVDRARAQLYEEVAGSVTLKGKDVLEISSGRGGGAAYLMEHHYPASIVGVDISKEAVRFCSAHYNLQGLSFKLGNAEALPFNGQQFDAVVNIEASHNYPSLDRFVSEAYRVLRPGGHFLFADMRSADKIDGLRSRLMRSRTELVSQRNITGNVLAALDDESDRTIETVNRLFPAPLWSFLYAFAGVKGTAVYNGLKSGKIQYWAFVLIKQ